MAFVHGRSTNFEIDNSGGTLTDISAFTQNVDLSREVDTPETTVYGDIDRTFVTGLRGASFSSSGFWEGTATTGIDDILAGILGVSQTISFQYGPEGDTMGNVMYSGECILTSYSVSSPVDGVAGYTADFQLTGAVTRDTYP